MTNNEFRFSGAKLVKSGLAVGHKAFALELQTLMVAELDADLVPSERRRREYLRWRIDKIEDALFGEEL